MQISGLMRLKCYIILEGLEQSLGENLNRNFDIQNKGFFNVEEEQRALKRIREDAVDENLEIDQISKEDILDYLDLGDLVHLLNRHASSAKNISVEEIRQATNIIQKSNTLTIRKRIMHPIRPLELEDFPKLSKLAGEIRTISPSLFWTPLILAQRRIDKGEIDLDYEIPSYWAEEPIVMHNLPIAEFDETGFIGRKKERRDLIKMLRSEHKVITVIGGGGIGKTALSLRVCNDILDEDSNLFDRIVWVSLKTRHLTHEGIREIKNAVDSVGFLIWSLFNSMTEDIGERDLSWDSVIEQLKTTKTLLVIDNLETIGEGIRELALEIPSGSKLLLTSRVGLGEIEVRYPLSGFLVRDAMALFRSTTNVHNFHTLMGINNNLVNKYVQALHLNPLLIKWFILAVGNGADPTTLLESPEMEGALEFCYENVYEKLSMLEKDIVSIMMASRRELTNAQLMELTKVEAIELVLAMQDLYRYSMVQRVTKEDGSISSQLGGLVYEYLNKKHPPTNNVVSEVRRKIRVWQTEQDKLVAQQNIYRYAIRALQAKSEDERMSAQHLLRAFSAIRNTDYDIAKLAIKRAEEITPVWWEVYRVEAYLLEAQNNPTYEIENAFEHSINCEDNDIVRYHYAAFLIKICEYDRALEQIDSGERFPSAQSPIFKSIKGVALMRKGQITDAIPIMKEVWENRTNSIPARIGRIQGTQLAEAYRRNIEQMLAKGNTKDVFEEYLLATNIISECVSSYGCDGILVELAVHVLDTVSSVIESDENLKQKAKEITDGWETNKLFIQCAQYRRNTSRHFIYNKKLEYYFPLTSLMLLKGQEEGILYQGQYSGTIKTIINRSFKPYGFISSKDFGDIFFNEQSLLNRNDWDVLKENVRIHFDKTDEKPPLLPRAVRISIDNSMSEKSS